MQSKKKLPFWRTVGDSISITVREWRYLARISWAWLLVMIPVYAFLHWAELKLDLTPNYAVSFLAYYINLLFELPFVCSIAVAWHRLLILRERFNSGPYFRLDRYIGHYMLMGILMVAAWLPLALVYVQPAAHRRLELFGQLIGLVCSVLLILTVSRLALLLPAIAIDKPLQLTKAWRFTQANSWRLCFGMLLSAWPAGIAADEITQLFVSAQSSLVYCLGMTASSVVRALGATAAVSFLSLAYKHLVTAEADQNQSIPSETT